MWQGLGPVPVPSLPTCAAQEPPYESNPQVGLLVAAMHLWQLHKWCKTPFHYSDFYTI